MKSRPSPELLKRARNFGIAAARLSRELGDLPTDAPARRAVLAKELAGAFALHGGKADLGARRLRDLIVETGLFQLSAPSSRKQDDPQPLPPRALTGPALGAPQGDAKGGVGQLFSGAFRFARLASGSPAEADKDQDSSS